MTTKRVRIRHSTGGSTIEVKPGSTTYGVVARSIESSVPSLTASLQLWKVGYPPRPASPREQDAAFPHDRIDMIHVSLVAPGEIPTVQFLNDGSQIEEPPPVTDDADGIMIRRVIDADNSCLFNSIGYLLLEKSVEDAPKLRQMVAQAVREDPLTFTNAFLGQDPQDYIKFITDPKAWGGQIELLIFSRLYQTEIAACDIIRNRVDIYGTDESFNRRIFVIYDGIHYDALAMTCHNNTSNQDADVTLFSPKNDAVLDKAKAICDEQHRKKAFVDTSNFTLRCLVCQKGLTGANQAQQHAQETGHSNFAEFQ